MVKIMVIRGSDAVIQNIAEFSESFIRKTFLRKDVFEGGWHGDLSFDESTEHCKVHDKVLVTAYHPSKDISMQIIGPVEFFQDEENNFPYHIPIEVNTKAAAFNQNPDTKEKYTVVTLLLDNFNCNAYNVNMLEKILCEVMNDKDILGENAAIKFTTRNLSFTVEDTLLTSKNMYAIDIFNIDKQHIGEFISRIRSNNLDPECKRGGNSANHLRVSGIVPKAVFFSKVSSDLTVKTKEIFI